MYTTAWIYVDEVTDYTFGSYQEEVAEFSIKNLNITNITEIAQTSNQVDFFGTFVPDVLSFNEYYPYGMLLPKRHGAVDSYRYGFQGQEKDDEVKGEGNSVNYKFRMHDPRLGRFFAVDPLTKKYPHYSPYSFSGNKILAFTELEGLEEKSIHWTGPYESLVNSVKSYFGFDYFDIENPSDSEPEDVAKILRKRQDALKRTQKATEDIKIATYVVAAIPVTFILVPTVAIEIAPMVITAASGEVIATKMIISAGSQMAMTGDIDLADVMFDGILINGAGEVVGGFVDLNIISGDVKLIGINKDEKEVVIDLATSLIAKGIEIKNESLINPKHIDPKAKKIFDAIYGTVISVTETSVNEKLKEKKGSNTATDASSDNNIEDE